MSTGPYIPPAADGEEPRVERQPPPLPEGPITEQRSTWQVLRGIGMVLIGLALFGFKYLKLAFIFLKGFKFFTTSVTMVLSIGAYAMLWGVPFAVGFVLLILVHEMGHVLQLRREGIDAGAPVFIPFLGAAIAMKEMPRDALMEARVGLAGPILGTAGALVVHGAALALDSQMLLAIAYTGYFINLFNLIPVSPLDGGRALAAVSPKMWFVGLVMLAAAILVLGPNPIGLLILLLGAFNVWSRWRSRHSDAEYYSAVRPDQRVMVLVVYLGLCAALVALMAVSFVRV